MGGKSRKTGGISKALIRKILKEQTESTRSRKGNASKHKKQRKSNFGLLDAD